jgi:hypothetical protein
MWPPQTILISDRLISEKSSPLKPLGQMNRNLVGSTVTWNVFIYFLQVFWVSILSKVALITRNYAKRFQRRRFFRNQPIRNKNCLWWPCLLMDRDDMRNHYRGPSIDASYQVSVHLAKWFFVPIHNKHGHHRQFLFLIGRFFFKIFSSETTWPNYQVSVHLAKWFQRRRFKKKIVQSETRIACDGHVCYGSGQNDFCFIEDLPWMLPTKFPTRAFAITWSLSSVVC